MQVRARRITAETLVSAVLISLALAIVVGWILGSLSVGIDPRVMAVVVAAVLASILIVYPEPSSLPKYETRADVAFCGAVVAVSFAYFLWLASPSLLPVTIAPDVVHHLMLAHLIQRTHHLAQDPALNPYLLEMAGYTPGSHLLTAMVAAWLRTDAIRVIHPIAAFFAALNLGIVYVVALRLLEGRAHARVAALAAPVLAFVPSIYTLGAFFHFFFFAQLVSETFALGMLFAVLDWLRGGRRALVLFAECSVAVFLVWPVWLAPPMAALAFAVPFVRRRRALLEGALALLPVLVAAVVQVLAHPRAAAILASSGAVTRPTIEAFGVVFLSCAAVGVVWAIRRPARAIVLVFLAGCLVQGIALGALGIAAGSKSFYLPFKMMYLAVPALAILGCVGLAWLAYEFVPSASRGGRAAAAVPLLVAVLLVRGRVPVHRQHSAIAEPALQAGEWARDHLPSGCIDYFSSYWLTGYWLHLDVLGNPRESERMRTESFEFRDAVGKWIEGRGLPYAFVEDLDLVPKDARVDMATVQRFGRAAIVRNLRPALCAATPPSLWTLQVRGQTPRHP